MDQEKEIFDNLAKARTQYANTSSIRDWVSVANKVESALARLLVIVKNYLELKSVENVQTLMVRLKGTENRTGVEGKRFNDGVAGFNIMTKKVLRKWIADLFSFEEKSCFKARSGAEEASEMKF